MKYILIALMGYFLTGCGSDNSDGSDPTTYSSCSIISSQAIFSSDREKDVSQCWDGVDYKEKSLAMDWCAQKVNSYISETYLVGHSVTYLVASTNCIDNFAPPLNGNTDSGSTTPAPPAEKPQPPTPSYIYNSCRITESNALFSSDRQKDESQCWDDQGFNSGTDALAWCKSKVEDYIDDEYLFGHSVIYSASPYSCST